MFDDATAGYELDPSAKAANEAICECVEMLHGGGHNKHFESCFEVGSGTGGTSSFVLPLFCPWNSRYVFSDLSTAFLVNAVHRFGNYPFVEFAIYSGEDAPGLQGYALHQYDLSLSTNCIHAMRHLTASIGGIAQLLNSTGHLCFNEVQLPNNYGEDLGFGMTDGWWYFCDTERRGFPLIRGAQWNHLFAQAGYKNIYTSPEEGYSRIQSILLAQIDHKAICDVPSPLTVEPPKLQYADPSRAYLLTGGIGGIGIVTALLLLELGAQHLIFTSRRDRVPTEAMDYYEKISNSICTIQRVRANAASYDSNAVMFGSQQLPKVAGLYHGAGVLSDGVFKAQTRTTFQTVMHPKGYGSYTLHNLSANKENDLEVFCTFSSAAAIYGNPGQPNHSSACAQLDAHAAFRAGFGLAGSSINWGAVGEVGYAARHSVGSTGTYIPLEHTINCIEAATRVSGSNIAAIPAIGSGLPWAQGLSERFRTNMASRTAAARQMEQMKEAAREAKAIASLAEPPKQKPSVRQDDITSGPEIDLFLRAFDSCRGAYRRNLKYELPHNVRLDIY